MSSSRERKALLVGIDGLNLPRIDVVEAPTLRRLRDHGYCAESTIYPDPPDGSEPVMTVSGPGWSTILTGTWPWTHGVRDNTIDGHRLGDHPDLLTRATRAGLRTFCAATWQPLYDRILTREVTDRVVLNQERWPEYEQTVVGSTVYAIADGVDLAFCYFGATDETAHHSGATSAAYDRAIEDVDRYLTALLRTVEVRTAEEAEDWLVLVTTDHGHLPQGGHGGQSEAERATFVLGTGGGLTSSAAPGPKRMVDIAPTLLAHVGLPDTAARNTVDHDGTDGTAANGGWS